MLPHSVAARAVRRASDPCIESPSLPHYPVESSITREATREAETSTNSEAGTAEAFSSDDPGTAETIGKPLEDYVVDIDNCDIDLDVIAKYCQTPDKISPSVAALAVSPSLATTAASPSFLERREATPTSSLTDVIDTHLTALRSGLLRDLGTVLGSNPNLGIIRGSNSNGGIAPGPPPLQHSTSMAADGGSNPVMLMKAGMRRKTASRLSAVSSNTNFSFNAKRRASKFSHTRGDEDNGVVGSVWPLWDVDIEDDFLEVGIATTDANTKSLGLLSKISGKDVVRSGDTVVSKGCCQLFIFRPNSVVRIMWEVLTLLVICYDILLIPMVVFDLHEVDTLRMITLCMALFWSTDMFYTFFVGFRSNGVIDMRPSKIAKRYLKSWFLLDALVLACDWYVVIDDSIRAKGGGSVGVVRISKSFRVARIFGALRFLRMWKVAHFFTEFKWFFQYESMIQLMGILNFTIVILLINHYIACGWYALAQYYPDGIAYTWLSDLRNGPEHHGNFLFEYTTSLHWSFTQFTPASMEVHPQNSYERIYSIIVLLSGLVVFSSFVSGITSAMTRVRENNKERNRQEENLRRYITDNKVSLELARRIYNYVRTHRLINRARVVENEITAFRNLPPQLLTDLHAEVFLPILTRHSFFHQFLHIDEAGLVEICHAAVGESAAVKGQHIFSFKQKALKMTFCSDGFLTYYLGADGQSSTAEEIRANDYLAEASLWGLWFHKGRLEATSNSVLVEIRAGDFHNVARQTYAFRSCVAYAHAFVEGFFADMSTASSTAAKCSTGTPPHLSDIWRDENVLPELARGAFEEQYEELNLRMTRLVGTTNGRQRQFGSLMAFFQMKSGSTSAKNLRMSLRNMKQFSSSVFSKDR